MSVHESPIGEFGEMPLKYHSGETIMKGDHVLFHGKPGEIEFVVEGLVGDPIMDWYMADGPGVMIREPKFFGSVYVCDTEDDRLVFVSRAEPE